MTENLRSEYDQVPSNLQTDRVMPSVSEFPRFISNVRHPRRNRSVSIGPQSEADAYEALAFRDKIRRDIRYSGSGPALPQPGPALNDVQRQSRQTQPHEAVRQRRHAEGTVEDESGFTLVEMPSSSLAAPPVERTPSQERREDEKEKMELFAKVEKPRVRYDVEVVTKLIVYTGELLTHVELESLLMRRRHCLDSHRRGTNPLRSNGARNGRSRLVLQAYTHLNLTPYIALNSSLLSSPVKTYICSLT